MAMSTSSANICKLCKNHSKRFCNSCQVELCVDCVRKHVDKLKSLSHDIAPFEKKNVQLVIPECETHISHRCEAYCQQCQIPVCIKCLIGPHKGHDALDIFIFAENKKQEIKAETDKKEEKLQLYKATSAKFQKKISEHAKVEENLKSLRMTWHNEVDVIFDKLSSQFHYDEKNLTINHNCIRNLISELQKNIQSNIKILQSLKASEVTKYTLSQKHPSEIQNNFEFFHTIPSLLAKTLKGTELFIELGEIRALLTDKSPKVRSLCMGFRKFRLFANIKTNHASLCRVQCVGRNEAWITNNKNIIKRFCITHNEMGYNMFSIICECRPDDISVTREGELIYSDNNLVKIVKLEESETLIAPPGGWKARGLCCTRSGDILVSVFDTEDKTNKVMRYEGQKITQEIHKDEHGIQLFKEGEDMLFLTENNNGDICVSDCNAERVVVVDRSGRLRFQYDGMAANIQESFDPRCILTDSLSHIIVSDINNNRLHVLDQNGKFLGCIDNCGLNTPLGLSLDSEGRLWVGSFFTGEIKVITYLNEHNE